MNNDSRPDSPDLERNERTDYPYQDTTAGADTDPAGFVLVAVIEDDTCSDVFTVVAYRPDDLDLLTDQFPGREARMLDPGVLSEHARAEVRAVLEMAALDGRRDGVVVGTTNGRGGWASWNLWFYARKPGPVPDLPEPEAPAKAQP